MDISEIQRDLGRFEAKIASLEITVMSLQTSILLLNAALAEARGSWRTIMILGGAASVLGAFIHKAIEVLLVGFK